MSINQEVLPQSEAPQPQSNGEESTPGGVETPAPKEKNTRQPAAVAAIPQAVPVPAPTDLAVPATPHPPDDSIQVKQTHLVADDVDLIEKEWVDRAKAIVEATQDDPHKQKSEISKVKAEYIQKRFNKTIKVDTPA
jgi:hypothetical protein